MDESTQSPVDRRSTAGQDRTANGSTPGVRVPASLPEETGAAAGSVDRAADELERLSSRLNFKDVGDLFRDAQQLARRQPVMFVLAAFAIGLLGARFLKSSAPQSSLPGTRSSREGLGIHAAGNP
jgi:hypothetical protein